MPALTFPMVPLRVLTALHLENICFRSDGGAGSAESFILQHPALRSLTLEDCPLFCYEQQCERSWATVLAGFAAGLEQLMEVKMNFSQDSYCYCYEDAGWGFITQDAEEAGVDGAADRRALEQLKSKVEARSRAELVEDTHYVRSRSFLC